MQSMLLNHESLKELLHYDPETGKLFWKFRDVKWFKNKNQGSCNQWNSKNAGKQAFCCLNLNSGYLCGCIFGKTYLTHRIIWFYLYGEWPEIVDHINGIKLDNRLINLRNVDTKTNSMNRSIYSNNKTGHSGIFLINHSGRYRIDIAGKYIGCAPTLVEAIKIREKELNDQNYHQNHGRK